MNAALSDIKTENHQHKLLSFFCMICIIGLMAANRVFP